METPAGQQAPNAWRVLGLLFLANLVNFYDRTIPAILSEPIRLEWGLSDVQLGLIAAAFTLVYAVAGLPLGRLADRGSRARMVVVTAGLPLVAHGMTNRVHVTTLGQDWEAAE